MSIGEQFVTELGDVVEVRCVLFGGLPCERVGVKHIGARDPESSGTRLLPSLRRDSLVWHDPAECTSWQPIGVAE